MIPLALLLVAAPPQVSPVPVDLLSLPLAEARRLDGRPVVVSPDDLGEWDRCGKFDRYVVAADDESERGVLAPGGTDLRGRRRPVGGTRKLVCPRPGRRA
jgi:hypothetical protein